MPQVARALITIAILQFTIIPMIADFGRSHATNSTWPGHARFHVVTQVLTTSGVGILALIALWSSWLDPSLGVCLATVLGAIALAGFFLSVAGARFYGGAVTNRAADTEALHVGDLNIANFGLSALLLITGRLLIAL